MTNISVKSKASNAGASIECHQRNFISHTRDFSRLHFPSSLPYFTLAKSIILAALVLVASASVTMADCEYLENNFNHPM
jgi:hypothetical protein